MILARDLQFTYDRADAPAVHELSFEIARGEIFGFLGPNGAGKSTTQKILIRLLRDYAGADWRTVADECGAPTANAARMMHARALTRLGALLRARGLS